MLRPMDCSERNTTNGHRAANADRRILHGRRAGLDSAESCAAATDARKSRVNVRDKRDAQIRE